MEAGFNICEKLDIIVEHRIITVVYSNKTQKSLFVKESNNCIDSTERAARISTFVTDEDKSTMEFFLVKRSLGINLCCRCSDTICRYIIFIDTTRTIYMQP